jgi:hypothetical protein
MYIFERSYIIGKFTGREHIISVKLNLQVSIAGEFREFFSSPPRPERLCGPSSLLSNGYKGLYP